MDLFGGDKVRGGSSYSELICDPFNPIAVFQGNLDIKTLGGAGFASQRTTGETRSWDLSSYDGITLEIAKSDKKQYTLMLKDALLPKSPNGREQSTVSWEYDFQAPKTGKLVFVKWDEFKATYRGREKKDAEPLDLKNVKRVSLMMRSFFGTQEGDFSLSIKSISVFRKRKAFAPYQDDPEAEFPKSIHEKENNSSKERGWLSWIFGLCVA